MTAAIQSHSPPRGRAGDSLTLGGAGFASSGNTVTVDGLAATVTAESTTSITVTVPGGIRTDRFVPVVATNPDDSTSSQRFWWSKATGDALRSFLMDLQKPGEFEDWGAASSDEHPDDVEAKDIESLHELLQYLPLDVLQTPGDMAGRNDNGVGQVTGGAGGETVALTHGTTGGESGIAHRLRKPTVLTWGRQLSNATATLMSGHAQANQGTTTGAEMRAPDGGRATRLVVYVDRQGGTRELDQVEVLVDGVVAHDSGAGLAVTAQGHYTANVWADLGELTASNRISVRLTGDSGTSTIDCLAALVVF